MADESEPTVAKRINSLVSRVFGGLVAQPAPEPVQDEQARAPVRTVLDEPAPPADQTFKPALDTPFADLPLENPGDPSLPLEAFDPELTPESFESVPTPLPLLPGMPPIGVPGPASDVLEPDGPEPVTPEPILDDRDPPPLGVAEAILAATAPPAFVPEPNADAQPERGSWWGRLRQGLSRSSSAIGGGITDLFAKRRMDATTLEDLEDILIGADLGVGVAGRIVDAVRAGRYERGIEPEAVRGILAREVEAVLAPVAKPFVLDRAKKPFVVLMVGVNGSGKTTTIGKLAQKYTRDGLSVTLAAGDTFRAAAIEQLRVWGQRTGAPVIAREGGGDAASLAFDAMGAARDNGSDVLMIDTAGRLQNKAQLMDELAKVVRVIRKVDAGAPHAVLLVLDATVGQNALSQVELFGKTAGVTGLVMTKLDGTARGGILVAIADRFGLPVHYIGVGEGVDDLEPFSARDFARAIAGLDEERG